MHLGGGPLLHSALGVGRRRGHCKRSRFLVWVGEDDEEDACAVDVWQDLFRADSRMWKVERMRGCAQAS